MASDTVNLANDGGFTAIFDAIFVASCPGCGGSLPRGAALCAVCVAELRRVPNPCARCGLPGRPARCPRAAAPWYVAAVTAPFVYESPVDHYVQALKYRRRRAIGRALALTVAPELRAERDTVDALVPVPLHHRRHRERGYNQADEIARALGAALHLPVLRGGIARRAPTPPQTAANAAERRANVAHAFHVRRNVAGLRLALVDDVVTTGATVNALARVLLHAGAARCVVWAIARTLES